MKRVNITQFMDRKLKYQVRYSIKGCKNSVQKDRLRAKLRRETKRIRKILLVDIKKNNLTSPVNIHNINILHYYNLRYFKYITPSVETHGSHFSTKPILIVHPKNDSLLTRLFLFLKKMVNKLKKKLVGKL